MFKKIRSIKIPYRRQGLIYFTCINFRSQPEHIQRKVKKLCDEVGGDDSDALYEMLTVENCSVPGICSKYFVSEKKLYKMRKNFYERW